MLYKSPETYSLAFEKRPGNILVLFCIVSEIKRGIGRKSIFFDTPPALDAPLKGVAVGILP